MNLFLLTQTQALDYTERPCRYQGANIQSRREADITREILRFVNKCLRSMRWDIWKIGVTWEDLTVPSATEKVDLANKIALINKEVGFITGELLS